ncbi:MAG: amidohydrolase family protein [Acidobacteria bacterium]|nr:amidohydrolase family protein [Acidobacteriota bacterium]
MMKIDVFNHILTQKFNEQRLKLAPPELSSILAARVKNIPALWDLDTRFKIMDMFEDYVQVLTLANPPLEVLAGPEDALELARIGNDEMAELVAKYPDRFVAAVASIPMNNVDGALKEMDRAINELGLKGVQIFSPMKGRALDHPDFLPVFEKIAEYDLPILLHPARNFRFADYPAEDESQVEIWHIFGWPYDTAAAMTRLVLWGIFDKYPNLKVITHHLGGLVPFTEGRILEGYNKLAKSQKGKSLLDRLEKHPHEYFRMFYADTVTNGSLAALECGVDFFGADQVVFATDHPFDSEGGSKYIRDTIRVLSGLTASDEDKKKIYQENAKRLFKL